MEKKGVSIFLDGLGFMFILLGIISIYNDFLWSFEEAFWFCNLVYILFGIGLLIRNSFLMASCISVVAIPDLFWTADFLSHLFTGTGIFGVVDYFFDPGWPLISKVISFQHVIIIPLALISFHFIKIKRKDFWKLSSVMIILIFLLTRIITSPENNINCVYESCINISFPEPIYPMVWFAATFAMMFLTSFVLTRLKFLKNKKRKLIMLFYFLVI